MGVFFYYEKLFKFRTHKISNVLQQITRTLIAGTRTYSTGRQRLGRICSSSSSAYQVLPRLDTLGDTSENSSLASESNSAS